MEGYGVAMRHFLEKGIAVFPGGVKRKRRVDLRRERKKEDQGDNYE